MHPKADIQKIPRKLLPTNYAVTDWNGLEPFFKELSERAITSKAELENWLVDLSELEAVVSEDACWRQIKMTCDTTDKSLEDAFTYFCMEIQPKLQQYADALNKKLVNCSFTAELDQAAYHTYLRSVKKSIELFRE
ncbi:MAG: M3 family oligoendopeptidase, partial [Sediminibacterium sp.]|nr:M3 family oligoendopeptidase [Sediminibacterium sp.]